MGKSDKGFRRIAKNRLKYVLSIEKRILAGALSVRDRVVNLELKQMYTEAENLYRSEHLGNKDILIKELRLLWKLINVDTPQNRFTLPESNITAGQGSGASSASKQETDKQ